jgi:hypothetical protein
MRFTNAILNRKCTNRSEVVSDDIIELDVQTKLCNTLFHGGCDVNESAKKNIIKTLFVTNFDVSDVINLWMSICDSLLTPLK